MLFLSSALLLGCATAALVGCTSKGGSTATLPSESASPTSTSTDTITVHLGDEFDFAGLKIKVTEIVDPLTTTESSFVPLPANRFAGVGFELTNPGNQTRQFSPPVDVDLADQNGGLYQILLGQRPGDFLGQEIKPGASVKGIFTFEMPDAAKPSIVEFRRQGTRDVNVIVTSR